MAMDLSDMVLVLVTVMTSFPLTSVRTADNVLNNCTLYVNLILDKWSLSTKQSLQGLLPSKKSDSSTGMPIIWDVECGTPTVLNGCKAAPAFVWNCLFGKAKQHSQHRRLSFSFFYCTLYVTDLFGIQLHLIKRLTI